MYYCGVRRDETMRRYPRLLAQLVPKLEKYEEAFERYTVHGRQLLPVLQEIVAVSE